MKAFVHIGMHKTGTTSIQRTLAALDLADPRYLLRQPANHSAMVSVLFEDHETQLPRLLNSGWTAAGVEMRRAEWRASLEETLRTHSAEGGEAVILSAERLCVVSFEAAERLRDFLAPHCSEVEIVAYVRSPISWMESAFQQSIKDRQNGFEALRWPNYRLAFEKYDRLFGRDNVTLKVFLKEHLKGGDVVSDFTAHVGIDPPVAGDRRDNETLSLEALSLVYVRRRFGRPFDWRRPGAVVADRAFVERLRPFGTQRFGLSPALAASILEANREDLAYIEDRLGMALPGGGSEAGTVGSEADLVAAALAAAPLLDGIDPDGAGSGPAAAASPEALAARLDRLFETTMEAAAAARGPDQEARTINRFARILWLAELAERPAEPAARQAAWLEARPRYVAQARRAVAMMQKEGLRIPADGDEDA